MKIIGSAVRAGNIIEYDGKIWRVVKHNVVSPGKGSAFNQVEMRDARTGTKTNIKLRADETVEQLRADEKEMQYLFSDGDAFTFMDQESFEQTTVNRDLIGDAADFLTDNMVCTVNLIEGEVVGVSLPQSTVCTVVEADAVVKGQTASSSYKPAVLDNGAKIMVPPFIAAGTRIVVNIEERTYLERAKD
ncbi:MAG: elongation factor P [Alphaproteobacteria bacterium]|nr:elongation factor P [Alphaproteobacteria bacterium]MBM3627104.1 elongation factor P [Alphaproteobacteria bacterium]